MIKVSDTPTCLEHDVNQLLAIDNLFCCHFPSERILEFESQIEGSGNKTSCEVELWDCSGDFKYAKH